MKKKKKIVLTPAAMQALVDGDMRNFIAAATPGGIEAQEADGQRTLVKSELLPREMRPDQKTFEALGIKFGEQVGDLFVKATLPKGWTKKADPENEYSSYLFDAKGVKRVYIFYKAAFYDQRASMRLV